jgi:hypothetical protein
MRVIQTRKGKMQEEISIQSTVSICDLATIVEWLRKSTQGHRMKSFNRLGNTAVHLAAIYLRKNGATHVNTVEEAREILMRAGLVKEKKSKERKSVSRET